MDATTLQRLIELAGRRTETAQARLAKTQRALEQAQSHLQMLQQYATEYSTRANGRPGDLRDPSAQRNEVHFLARLEQAVAAQEHELRLRTDARQAAATDLAQSQRRQKSLETLQARALEAGRQVQARREQKEIDELAQRTRAVLAHNPAGGFEPGELP